MATEYERGYKAGYKDGHADGFQAALEYVEKHAKDESASEGDWQSQVLNPPKKERPRPNESATTITKHS